MDKTSSKYFRKCMSLSPCFITPKNTQSLCIVCLGVEHTCSALEGAGWVHCDKFTVRKLHSRLALFSWDEVQASAPLSLDPRQYGDSDCGAHRPSWMRNLRKGFHFLSPCLLARAICWLRKHILWHLHDPAESMLLTPSSSEEVDVVGEGEESEFVKPSPSCSPTYREMLDVMAHTWPG